MTVLRIEKDRNFTTYTVETSNRNIKEYCVCDHPTNGRFLVSVYNDTRKARY